MSQRDPFFLVFQTPSSIGGFRLPNSCPPSGRRIRQRRSPLPRRHTTLSHESPPSFVITSKQKSPPADQILRLWAPRWRLLALAFVTREAGTFWAPILDPLSLSIKAPVVSFQRSQANKVSFRTLLKHVVERQPPSFVLELFSKHLG